MVISPNGNIYNITSAPDFERLLWKNGQKDYKSPKTKEVAVTLSLVVISEATPIKFLIVPKHELNKDNRRASVCVESREASTLPK